MGRKKKKKKVSAKKEKYAKFRKEKPDNNTFEAPDITPEQQQQRKHDEVTIGNFLRFNRSKRDHTKGIGGKRQ